MNEQTLCKERKSHVMPSKSNKTPGIVVKIRSTVKEIQRLPFY
ncbi:4593_t:CDS:1 [Cetraspora pellucida]|uniref:4593_t:CDS:1 n=1 Tax=Cetraspora pellucida TaxID=1433469 RepID=A0A9N9AL44_9GLOM|nr:4593_t:CDS:1 [Cetraspora pellucida]